MDECLLAEADSQGLCRIRRLLNLKPPYLPYSFGIGGIIALNATKGALHGSRR